MSKTAWQLLSLRGTVSPGRYFLIGALLTPIKMGLDYLVATRVFKREWSPLNYALTGEVGGLFSLDNVDAFFYAIMLAIALPFLVIGLSLTVQRLRDVGWPAWIVVLFFAPLPINVVFFLILSVTPGRNRELSGPMGDVIDGPMGSKPKVERRRFAGGRAFLSILIPLPFAAAVAYFGTNYLRDYGWSLFVGFPFVVPMISVIIYGAGRDVTLGECLAVGWLWILTAVVVMVMTAFEGLICIIMMLPLAIPIVLLGAAVGYCVAAIGRRSRGDLARVTLLLFAILPTMVGAEHLTAPEPLLFLCETSVEIERAPEKVWENVVKFSDLDPPTDWLFRAAWPTRFEPKSRAREPGPSAAASSPRGHSSSRLKSGTSPVCCDSRSRATPRPCRSGTPCSTSTRRTSTASSCQNKGNSC